MCRLPEAQALVCGKVVRILLSYLPEMGEMCALMQNKGGEIEQAHTEEAVHNIDLHDGLTILAEMISSFIVLKEEQLCVYQDQAGKISFMSYWKNRPMQHYVRHRYFSS
jgi:hypothetical protein